MTKRQRIEEINIYCLPKETLEEIFFKIKYYKDVITLCLVSKRFYEIYKVNKEKLLLNYYTFQYNEFEYDYLYRSEFTIFGEKKSKHILLIRHKLKIDSSNVKLSSYYEIIFYKNIYEYCFVYDKKKKLKEIGVKKYEQPDNLKFYKLSSIEFEKNKICITQIIRNEVKNTNILQNNILNEYDVEGVIIINHNIDFFDRLSELNLDILQELNLNNFLLDVEKHCGELKDLLKI